MNDNPTIVAFLKFGRKEDILDLYENGTVYMNSIQHFRRIEDGYLRGDHYEGVSSIINSLPGQFDVMGKTINYLSIHIPQSYSEVYGNIYSLYAISSYGFKSPKDFYIDPRVKEFGTHCILISPGEFLNKVNTKLDLIGLKHYDGFVDYYDKHKVNGKINLFQKPHEYEYQKEFRIYVKRDQITPLVFKIGSLKDFAHVFTSDMIGEITLGKAA